MHHYGIGPGVLVTQTRRKKNDVKVLISANTTSAGKGRREPSVWNHL